MIVVKLNYWESFTPRKVWHSADRINERDRKTDKIVMKNRKSGFTLLELLIVVAILAVLVALAMPFFQDYLAQSRLTAARADLTSYQKALASYDQLENTMFGYTGSASFTQLIGKYVQDFRAFATQTAPLDPWGNPYQVHAASGTVLSVGPNGSIETQNRDPLGDDLVTTWKPEFFVSDVKKIGDNKADLTFTRKVKSVSAANVVSATFTGGPAASTEYLRISDTVYRFTFAANLPATDTFSIEVDDAAIVAQDGKALLDADLQPDGLSQATNATFTPIL